MKEVVKEYNSLRRQIGALKRGIPKYLPRKISSSQKQLARKLQEIEAWLEDYDEKIEAIFEAIRQLMAPPEKLRKPIGFEVKEPKRCYGKK